MQHSLILLLAQQILIKFDTENILNLFEKFLYIINDRHSEVMCAKYGRSRMNDACTVCPANFVCLPAKSHMADRILF